MAAPRLLICGFDSFPAAPVNPAAATVRGLADAAWRAGGCETDYLVVPVLWNRSPDAIQQRLVEYPAAGVLVVGVAVQAQAFRVETLARNVACEISLDADRQAWAGGLVLPDAPPTLPATSPSAAMIQAIGQSGLPVDASDDAGNYLCNFTLYRLLQAAAAAAIGFLHVPQARECDPAGRFGLDQIELAVQSAAEAFAVSLARPAAGALS